MKRFIQRFSDKIIGVLSGFDRVLIRGTIRAIALHSGMREFLYQNGVLLKDFGTYGLEVTKRIREMSHKIADRQSRPFIYVPSSETNKEEIALRVLKEQPVERGLICMLPLHREIFKKIPLDYYWSTVQSEWATDIMFKNRSDLAEIYSAILPHALTSFSSPDVMRFLGKRLHGNFQGEVMTDYKERLEGIRIKHRAGTNSVKVYDKFQIVLRVETTINNPRDFRVFRPVEKDPERKLAWQALRQGVADLHRRVQISQASNERYLDALAEIDSSTPLGSLFEQISLPVRQDGKRFRALRPSDPQDIALFKAVADARFSINGFRNRDLQQILFEHAAQSEKERQSRSAKNQSPHSSPAEPSPGSTRTPYISLSADSQRCTNPDGDTLHQNDFTRTAQTRSRLTTAEFYSLQTSRNSTRRSKLKPSPSSVLSSIVRYSEFNSCCFPN